MSDTKFIYIIYDIYTHEVFNYYNNEEKCISDFNKYFRGFINADWIALNLTCCIDRAVRREKDDYQRD